MNNHNISNIYKNASKLGLKKDEIQKMMQYKKPAIEKKIKNSDRDFYRDQNAFYGPIYFTKGMSYYGSVSIKDFK